MDIRSIIAAGVLAATVSAPAGAFNVFSLGGDQALKWGSNTVGTPGGTVTWSLMPDGTSLDPSAPGYMHGTSNLSSVFLEVGGQAAALSMLQNAFGAWSAVADVQFQFIGTDDGTPFGASYAAGQSLGHIRIGAFEIDGFSAAVGFAAPPNGGTTLEGDLIFNSRSDISFFVAPGSEGDLYDLFPPGGGAYRNDFQGLAAHEIGHTLGLDHTDVTTALMCGGSSSAQCYWSDPDGDGKAPITRLPKLDDIAGAQYLYGPAPIPEPQTWLLLLAGLALVGMAAHHRFAAPGKLLRSNIA
ncbi:MAG: matrixin family metalloprotease [Burkholderiales bacterium]|nr:matrixin family metalloprotease [Burkholderiales bacterium]